ncbi:MAG: sodium:solute symporter [Bacteroidales bacterium]|jgi:Na+/proline symporter|nr:sodium:solute symporter [Bacteroidales bacterium]
MTPGILLISFLIYTALIFLISRFTLRKVNNESYYLGNRNSPWYVVAYGMIGASLSGVTFMSVPGLVKEEQFSYMVLVLGYQVGYFVIAFVLLPLYYQLRLPSIYSYLEERYGMASYKTGSFYFILSRLIGSSFRMFLVVNVLQLFVFDAWGIPMWLTVAMFMVLILLYTFKGGIKTIVWTDTLQTTFMISAVIITTFIVVKALGMNFSDLFLAIREEGYTKMFITDVNDPRFFVKQFFAGMFITIVMTGLDQDMMQKNLSCRNLRDAKKNVLTFGAILIPVNLLFLFLGAVLWMYAEVHGVKVMRTSDELFPILALQHLGAAAGLTFFFGLISAAYSSADGTLTALTTTFTLDFLGLKRKEGITEERIRNTRYLVHIGFAVLVMLIILGYGAINNEALISKLFTIAGYTYGPLLGLYFFGLYTKRKVRDRWVPVVAVLSPVLSYLLSQNSERLFWGYKFGFEILIVNGLFTFLGLLLLSLNIKKGE